MQSYVEVDKEDLYTLKINCKGERTVGKASPPGQPQEQNPKDNPHAEVEIKPQLKPRGSVAK